MFRPLTDEESGMLAGYAYENTEKALTAMHAMLEVHLGLISSSGDDGALPELPARFDLTIQARDLPKFIAGRTPVPEGYGDVVPFMLGGRLRWITGDGRILSTGSSSLQVVSGDNTTIERWASASGKSKGEKILGIQNAAHNLRRVLTISDVMAA